MHQEIPTIPDSSIAENMMLDKMITYGRSGIVNWRAVHERARQFLVRVGLDLSPAAIVRKLSVAQKQLIQIARALAANTRVLPL